MGSFNSLLTTRPGPSVAGPPANSMIRAPVLGNVVYDVLVSKRLGGLGVTTHLQKSYCDTQCYTSAPQGALVVCHRPWITRQRLQNSGQLELALLHREKEASCAERLGWHRLSGTRRGTVLRAQSKHVLNLLRRVLLATPEHIRLAALRISELVNLSL